MLYGFCGFIGSGKDAAAKALIDYTHASKLSFAGTLKDIVSVLFSWDREMMEGTTEQSRLWREQQDAYWSKALGFLVTPRKILQLMGTEVFRNFHKEIWIRAAERKLQLSPTPVNLFTDCRFGNEMDFIHQQQGTLVWISRPGCETLLPASLKDAEFGYRDLTIEQAAELTTAGLHASETSFLTEGANKLDVVIINNAKLDDLVACVRHMHDVLETPRGHIVIPIGKGHTVYLEKHSMSGDFVWRWRDEENALGCLHLPDLTPATV
jgi:hypothetical protein